jgi:Tfp pilus assembly protein PilV
VRKRLTSGFSLVEVTLALGIAAFCLIAVLGLIPVGVQTNRNATSQTGASSIIRAVVADLRAMPKAAGTWTGTSSEFCIPLGTSTTLFFDSAGRCCNSVAGTTSPCGVPWVPPIQPCYQVNITFPSPGNLTYADLKVTWPAAATVGNASGSIEMFAAFDRR